jgi:3-deoxy-D-manno-octulosonate 8-phosphate phosphatase (KDO 8-P phosphatase)
MVSYESARLRLVPAEAHFRACRLKLVITDCDGVLTDGSVYYGPAGEILRRFSVRDGMGVERLRDAGIATAIMSGEDCGSIRRRARKLDLAHVRLGVRDKGAELPSLLAAAGVEASEAAYIGDDVNDLEVLQELGDGGLTAAPADALLMVADAVHYRCRSRGGEGAFREFAEWILDTRLVIRNEWRRHSWQERW